MKLTHALPIAAVLALPAMAFAQDSGLYPDPSSPDASFLRVISDAETIEIGGDDVEPGAAGATPYVEVAPGEVEIDVGDASETVTVGANTHYTYVAGSEPELIEDQVADSPKQADLVVYNLTDMDGLAIYAVEAETDAIADISAGQHAGVGLKAPLTLTFEVRQDGETLASLDPVDLRRGTATTVILREGDDGLTAETLTSSYD